MTTYVALYPYQMNNKIYLNLKSNLENMVVGKCFSRYGLIMRIIEILDYKEGHIDAENMEGTAIFNVQFSCRLCAPLEKKQIICQISQVNKSLVTAQNGPIRIIITPDRINDSVFYKDHNDNIRFKEGDTTEMLKSNQFVKISLLTVKSNDGDEIIKAIGHLEGIATESEVKSFYDSEYMSDDTVVVYDAYEKQEIEITKQQEEMVAKLNEAEKKAPTTTKKNGAKNK